MRRAGFTIGAKLMGATGAMLVLTGVLSVNSIGVIGEFREQFDTAVERTVRKIILAESIDDAHSDMAAAQMLIIAGAAMKANQDIDTGVQLFREKHAKARSALERLKPLLVLPEGRALAGGLDARLNEWQATVNEIEKHAREGNVAQADHVRMEKATPVLHAVQQAASRLVQMQLEILDGNRRDAEKSYARTWWIAMVLLGVSMLIGGGVAMIVRDIERGLKRTSLELAGAAEQLAVAASSVSISSQALAQGASEQAASLEETTASAEEIGLMARRNTESSVSAAALALTSQERLLETNQTLQTTVVAMDDINAQSRNISKIIKVIDEIAFQTNILALNAAVEAARAGEAGKGFAVVAEEVRNLAQRCAEAASDTAKMIETSIAKAGDGKTKVDRMASAIHAITGESGGIQKIVEEVNEGSIQQTRGIEQVGEALARMAKVVQSTAGQAEECAAAAEELNAQAERLREIVSQLTATVGGAGDMAGLPPVAPDCGDRGFNKAEPLFQ